MGTGYTRNDTSNNIANGNVIDAADLDGEFDAIATAFGTSGHSHDGTTAEGGAISVVGPTQEFLGDGSSFYPKSDATYDLGKSTASFDVAYVESINLGGTGVTASAAEINYTDGVTSNIQTQLGTKLPLAGGAMTGAITTNSTFDGRDVATDGTKLDGIAAGATNTVGNATHTGEVTGSGALTIAADVVDAGNLKVTGNGTTSQFLRSDGDGTFTWATPTDTNTVYSHPTHPGDDASVDTGALTGATVISDLDFNITTDTLGHVTDANATVATRNLTLANLGYTGATDANNSTSNATHTGEVTGSGALTVANDVIDAGNLKVTGNGTTAQFLRSDGDGTFTWATPTDTNTTYSAGAGLNLSGTTFNIDQDLRGDVTQIGHSSSDYYLIGTTTHKWYLDGNEDMRLENDGDLHCFGNVIAYSTTLSDERLKKDIVKIDNALDKVSQLNGYTFEYLTDGKKSAGVIAQEVEKVMPSAIVESTLPLKMGDDDKTEYKTVQYDQLHGLMIEAIKELKAEIETLKGK